LKTHIYIIALYITLIFTLLTYLLTYLLSLPWVTRKQKFNKETKMGNPMKAVVHMF